MAQVEAGLKVFLKIVLGALVFFMALAITQEWRVFFAGQPHSARLPLDPEQNRQVEQTVREFVSLSRHLYQSAGDPRFAERLPASERVSSELLADLAYLKKNRRTQSWQLARLEVLDVERLSPDHSIVRSKEFWIVRTKRVSDGNDSDPVQSLIAHIEYELTRKNLKWQVSSWDLVDAPPAPAPETAPETGPETTQESTDEVH